MAQERCDPEGAVDEPGDLLKTPLSIYNNTLTHTNIICTCVHSPIVATNGDAGYTLTEIHTHTRTHFVNTWRRVREEESQGRVTDTSSYCVTSRL